MANSILSTLLQKPQFKAVNEKSGSALWSDLAIVAVEIDNSSDNTEKPISNQTIVDNQTVQLIQEQDIQSIRIILPSRLKVTALCSNISTVENVISTFLDDTVTISVTTKSIITSYLVLTDVEIEQSAEMISASKITLIFEQAQPPASSGYAPEQSADSSVYGVSIQNPPTVVPLASLVKAVSSAAFVSTISVSGALIDQAGGPFILDSSRLA